MGMAGQGRFGRSNAGGPMPAAPGEAPCISGEARAVMSITPAQALVTPGKLCRMIMEPTKLHLPSLLQCLKYAALPGGVSRAAKGADCKSAGLAFAGSSPASPTSVRSLRELRLGKPAQIFGAKRAKAAAP